MNSNPLLTINELNELLEIIHSLVGVENIAQFKNIAYSLKELVACENIIFGVPPVNSGESLAVNDLNINYPQEWVSLYQSNEFWRIDPVVLAAMEQHCPQHWSDIYRKFPPDKKFLSLAHDFGLKDGCTCLAIGGSHQKWTIISVGGKLKKEKKKTEYIFERLSPHFHIALSSLKVRNDEKKLHDLTNREREVLKWLSYGKTSWEISVILNVAEATVNFHVKNITAKLNVVGRSHAVAVAVHGGLRI